MPEFLEREFGIDILPRIKARLPSTLDDPHNKLRRMTKIEQGARAEYLNLASKARRAVICCFMLYGMAIWLIALVIEVQAVSVAKAVAFHSVLDLFLHGSAVLKALK